MTFPRIAHVPVAAPGFLVAVLLCAAVTAEAQPFRQALRGITVLQAGDTLRNPFSGGINNPVFQFVDIDADGDLDLFVLDRDRRLTLYRNEGSVGTPAFVLEDIGFQNLDVGGWFKFADIDADGDKDLFSGGESFGVSFFRNTGTSFSPSFTLETSSLRTSAGSVIVADQQSVHTLADIDGDGDLDFFSGNQLGTIAFYRNHGSPTVPQFEFVTDSFQGITIVGVTRSPVDDEISIDALPSSTPGTALHGAMAFDFFDVEGDGDLDIFWGDFFNRSLYFIRNDGTPTVPQMVLADSTFPDEAPVFTDGYNMPALVDIDADGDLDLFIGVLYFGPSLNTFQFYRNDGTPAVHDFVPITQNFLPTIDVGATSVPMFVDIDGDGDRDLLLGSEPGTISILRREDEHLVADSTPLLSLPGLFNLSPAAADLNGDGKVDLIVGDFNGHLRFFLQNDTGFVQAAFSLDGVNFGLNASPLLADITGDQLVDLLVGTGGGQLHLYRNSGSSSFPVFVLESSNYLGIDVGDDARPTIRDMDGDGKGDLVIGNGGGNLLLYRNDGTQTAPSFGLVAGFFDGVSAVMRSAPAFEDVDRDGDPDLFLGNVKGGLYFFENTRGPAPAPPYAAIAQNYPNPFSQSSVIRYSVPVLSRTRIDVYDLLGRKVATLVDRMMDPGVHTVEWNARGLVSGVYYVRLHTAGVVVTSRATLVR